MGLLFKQNSLVKASFHLGVLLEKTTRVLRVTGQDAMTVKPIFLFIYVNLIYTSILLDIYLH